jgi:hypothetical protein
MKDSNAGYKTITKKYFGGEENVAGRKDSVKRTNIDIR